MLAAAQQVGQGDSTRALLSGVLSRQQSPPAGSAESGHSPTLRGFLLQLETNI